ncbi:unnamed protein product [Penicillium discolor]
MATTTTTGALASSTGCGTSAQYEIPIKDASWVTAYDNDCAIYAPAIDQSVHELTECLYKAGVAWKDVWCYGDTNATATATSYPTSTETSTKSSSDKTSSGTSTESAATSTSTSSGADASLPQAHTSLKAVVLLSTLFASALFIGV